MESYSVLIKRSAVAELEAIPKKDRQRVAKRIAQLASDPRPSSVQKLSGLDRYRVRQGNYRVGYAVDDAAKQVVVFRIGHRGDVYR